MLNHNHRCPSHSPETVNFWEAITQHFSYQCILMISVTIWIILLLTRANKTLTILE